MRDKSVKGNIVMEHLKLHQKQLLDLVSFALFGGEQTVKNLTPELLREANQQAVLTLLGVTKEISPDFFYYMHRRL